MQEVFTFSLFSDPMLTQLFGESMVGVQASVFALYPPNGILSGPPGQIASYGQGTSDSFSEQKVIAST